MKSSRWNSVSLLIVYLVFTAGITLGAADPSSISKYIESKGQDHAKPAKTINIVAFSDINGSLGNLNYQTSVHRGLANSLLRQPDVVIGVGDYVGGEDIRKRFPDSHFPLMWDSFKLNILDKILANRVEFAPSPGNHDASGYSNLQREREVYLDFWNRNKPRLNYVEERNYPKYYSYMVDDVFFLSMDDVTPFTIHHGDIQREWIKKQLESEIAQGARARIVYGHIPLYPLLDKNRHSSGNSGKYYEVLKNEQFENSERGLEKVFIYNRVDLAIFAHSHIYYPGTVVHQQGKSFKKLRVLSMPCLGPGARYVAGQNERSPMGYVTISIDPEGKIELNAYRSDDSLIDKANLPERITIPGQFNRYLREDKALNLHSPFN
jgi:hypothetical protein